MEVYKNTIHYSARNLWYRMIHQQSPSKLVMLQRQLKHDVSNRCCMCNEIEDAKHIWISCGHKLNVGTLLLQRVSRLPKFAGPHRSYITEKTFIPPQFKYTDPGSTRMFSRLPVFFVYLELFYKKSK